MRSSETPTALNVRWPSVVVVPVCIHRIRQDHRTTTQRESSGSDIETLQRLKLLENAGSRAQHGRALHGKCVCASAPHRTPQVCDDMLYAYMFVRKSLSGNGVLCDGSA